MTSQSQLIGSQKAGFDVRHLPNARSETKSPREAQILSAAFEEFAAHGFAAARLDKVAERANVAKGTIYLYFANKSRLFQAVLRDLIRPIPQEFEEMVKSSSASACQLLGELISRQYAEVVTNRKARAVLGLLIAESAKFPQLSEFYYREVVEPGIRAIRLILDKGIAAGEFRKEGAGMFPEMVAAPSVLAIVQFLIHGNRVEVDLDAYKAAHVEFILSALRRTTGSSAMLAPESVASQGAHP
jgi:AcrR family transcriptional regulator